MTMTFKLIRGFEKPSNLDRLARALRQAIDPSVSLRDFQTRLRGAARAREHELASTSGDFRFAIDDLLPLRIRGIERHVKVASVDARAFGEFLDHLLEITAPAINSSTDINEVAEALAAALDDLHGYVLAHSLVREGYLEAELAYAARLLANAEEHPDPVDEEELAVSSAEDNLVLAA
jgi:hypothetical protein